jgi:hypothetical protein
MTIDKTFLLKWILVTSIGWLFAQTIAINITCAVYCAAYPLAKIDFLATSPLYWAAFGAVFGLSQWIILRDRVPHTFGWVLATTIGFGGGSLILKGLNQSELLRSIFLDYPFVSHLCGGIILGLTQYLIIRRKLKLAYWWIIIVAVSWAITQEIIMSHYSLIQTLGILIFTAITGLIFESLLHTSTQLTPAA